MTTGEVIALILALGGGGGGGGGEYTLPTASSSELGGIKLYEPTEVLPGKRTQVKLDGQKAYVEVEDSIPSVDDINNLPDDKWTLFTGPEDPTEDFYPGNLYYKDSATGEIRHSDKRAEAITVDVEHHLDDTWHFKLDGQEGLFTDGLDTFWDYLAGNDMDDTHVPLAVVRFFDASLPAELHDSKQFSATYTDLNLTDVYVAYNGFKLHLTKAGTVIHCEKIVDEIPLATTETVGGIQLFNDGEVIPDNGAPVKLNENGKAFVNVTQTAGANTFKFGYDPDNPAQATWTTPNSFGSEDILTTLYDKNHSVVLTDINVTGSTITISFDNPLKVGDEFTLVYSANASGAIPSIYQHFWGVMEDDTDDDIAYYFNILSSKSTMTKEEMIQWLYDNGFRSRKTPYPVYGMIEYRSDLWAAEHPGSSTDTNFGSTEMVRALFSDGTSLRILYYDAELYTERNLIKLIKTVKIV